MNKELSQAMTRVAVSVLWRLEFLWLWSSQALSKASYVRCLLQTVVTHGICYRGSMLPGAQLCLEIVTPNNPPSRLLQPNNDVFKFVTAEQLCLGVYIQSAGTISRQDVFGFCLRQETEALDDSKCLGTSPGPPTFTSPDRSEEAVRTPGICVSHHLLPARASEVTHHLYTRGQKSTCMLRSRLGFRQANLLSFRHDARDLWPFYGAQSSGTCACPVCCLRELGSNIAVLHKRVAFRHSYSLVIWKQCVFFTLTTLTPWILNPCSFHRR